MSAGHDDAGHDNRGTLLAVIGAIVVVAWCAAIATGLGRVLLGANAEPRAQLWLYAPGVVVGSALIALAGMRRLREHAPRWVPREAPAPVPGAPEPSPLADEAQEANERPRVAARGRMRRETASDLAIVHLGPVADPAWAAWGLRWEAPGHGAGFVPLPSGARVLLGRDPIGDIVVRLDQVSWHHLELDVQEARVIAFELGSSNGSRPEPEGAPLKAREPWQWAPGAALHLASPVAVSLWLEPLR